MNLNDLNKVWEIKTLKKVRENEAKDILEKVAKQVEPIMRKRRWKVHVLCEFCPANPGLLGLNVGGGAEVKIRLRSPFNELEFLPYNQILDTMLHELCHNVHGPHNADFYNLLDEIRKECEQGFDLPGRRLGGYTRQPPLSSLRQSALAAAENRANRGSLMPSGPRRIGGDSNIKSALSPIQAAAMAAERRMKDDLWCASRSSESNGVTETSKSSESEGVPETIKPSITIAERLPETSVAPTSSQEARDAAVMWQCGVCTLSNQPLALICEACGNAKHESRTTKKQNVWSCKFCTLNNSTEVEKCLACGEWRYSYGAPAFSRGPYVGT
ncbi:DNA-dependent metalloprotease WSS1-like [Apium graveolens]|uniref:DNA-dependent metalloprotease WSS1-like n=1 Tax=Apium graveolens TaxID=4045 RepID=UPI003D7BC50F